MCLSSLPAVKQALGASQGVNECLQKGLEILRSQLGHHYSYKAQEGLSVIWGGEEQGEGETSLLSDTLWMKPALRGQASAATG